MNPEEETAKLVSTWTYYHIVGVLCFPIGVSDLVFVDKFAIIAGDR